VGGYSDSVAIGADGAIYAVWDGEVVRMNRAGEVTLRIANAIEAAMGEPETTTKIAVDGLGNIYALGISQDVLVKFDRSGVFVDRVAVANRSSDEAASKLRAATALAVDSRGWVYVADLFGIKIYDADGQYRATLDIPSVAFGLAIDDQDVLSIAARTEVLRYQLQP
jgi:sugar lactone lactonase YvrE